MPTIQLPTAQEILAVKLARWINSHDGCQCVTINPGTETLVVRSLVSVQQPDGSWKASDMEEMIPATVDDVNAWLGY